MYQVDIKLANMGDLLTSYMKEKAKNKPQEKSYTKGYPLKFPHTH